MDMKQDIYETFTNLITCYMCTLTNNDLCMYASQMANKNIQQKEVGRLFILNYTLVYCTFNYLIFQNIEFNLNFYTFVIIIRQVKSKSFGCSL